MQLQRHVADFDAAGVALFGLSYDSVDVLRKFADEFGITYNVLSDEGSAVIRRLGLLNHHIVEQQAFYGFDDSARYRGLPYPGAIIVDEAGVVTRRLFDQSYRERPSPGLLLLAAAGWAPPTPTDRIAPAGTEIVELSAWFDETSFRPMERRVLTVRLDIASGWHIFVSSVDRNLTALSVNVGPEDALKQFPAELPKGRPFTVEGLAGQSNVVDGTVDIAIPILLQGAGFLPDGTKRSDPGRPGRLDVDVEVSWQACSATECLPPERHVLRTALDEEGQVFP